MVSFKVKCAKSLLVSLLLLIFEFYPFFLGDSFSDAIIEFFLDFLFKTAFVGLFPDLTEIDDYCFLEFKMFLRFRVYYVPVLLEFVSLDYIEIFLFRSLLNWDFSILLSPSTIAYFMTTDLFWLLLSDSDFILSIPNDYTSLSSRSNY